MSRTPLTRGYRAVIAAAGLALVASPLALMPNAQAAVAPIELNLLDINDFHGRIDANTTKFATTVEQLRAAGGESNTLFLSAGDNIGASLFASSSADDNPTIDVLNALGLQASAVGNHEFDKGYDDLIGRVSARAGWDYLGANVYLKGTQTPALDEYKTYSVGGITVGVIGAITQETPSLVTPTGIATLDFGDPVDAVNRVATQLTDGNGANGEADVLVASYHEGASEGTPAGATLEEELANGGAFADIVNNTDAGVDAIFTGHTHKQYAWDGLIPGDTVKTRPILQTGSYGENVGQIKLTVDPATDEVTAYTVGNVTRAAAEDTSLPRVAAVKQIVDDALAAADEIGKQPVGEVSADITSAYAGGSYIDGTYVGSGPNPGDGRDDRSSESSLGNLVADSLVASLSSPERGGAEIGVVNPGGLRNELFYAGDSSSTTNADGVVTYAEANSVLPFVNNLWTLTLTGAQFKQVLEQQFQTNPDGTVPSRPFLHLGLSKNVSTTLDPTRPSGERVTSMRVNGEPLDVAREYRIGTFNFLATGGDNFRAFTDGTDVKDSGLVDRDAWIDYLGANKPVSPAFDRRQVFESGIPPTVVDSQHVAFTLNRLDLTSVGSPKNTEVTASLKPASGAATNLGTFPVSDTGSANVDFTAPENIPAGSVVELVASPSNTTVTIPVAKAIPTMELDVKEHLIRVDRTKPKLEISLTATGQTVSGYVTVRTGGALVALVHLKHGEAVAKLPKFESEGEKTITAEYLGSDRTESVMKQITIRVVK